MRIEDVQLSECQSSVKESRNFLISICILLRISEKDKKNVKRNRESKKHRFSEEIFCCALFCRNDENLKKINEIDFFRSDKKDICALIQILKVKKDFDNLNNSECDSNKRNISRSDA